MVFRLYISSSPKKELGPLEVKVNVNNGRLSINSKEIVLKNYSLIGGPEYREGKYPALKVIYSIEKRNALKEDSAKIESIEGLNVREEKHDSELIIPDGDSHGILRRKSKIDSMIPVLDLIFQENTLIICSNFDVFEITKSSGFVSD